MDDRLLDAARLVRGYLPDLVGARAGEYDTELRDLLGKAAAGVDVDEEVAGVLERSQAVQAWAAQVLSDERGWPPELQQISERAHEALPGLPSVVQTQLYECPVNRAFQWARPFIGSPIPFCPDHPGALLVRRG
jgi:hypothetical protein